MKNTWLVAAGLGVVGTAAYLISHDYIPKDLGIGSLMSKKEGGQSKNTPRTFNSYD